LNSFCIFRAPCSRCFYCCLIVFAVEIYPCLRLRFRSISSTLNYIPPTDLPLSRGPPIFLGQSSWRLKSSLSPQNAHFSSSTFSLSLFFFLSVFSPCSSPVRRYSVYANQGRRAPDQPQWFSVFHFFFVRGLAYDLLRKAFLSPTLLGSVSVLVVMS